MNQTLLISIIITVMLFVSSVFLTKEAIKEGNGDLGKTTFALLRMVFPIVCWMIYGIILLFNYIQFV